MRSAVLVASLWLCVGVDEPGRSRFLSHLPADFTWARFDLEMVFRTGDDEHSVSGSLMVSSVGQEMYGGEQCRWVEFRTVPKDVRRRVVLKVLIPESELMEGSSPLAHVVRGWRKVGEGKEKPIKQEGQREAEFNGSVWPLQAFLCGPVSEVKELDRMTVKTALGEFDCEGWTGVNSFQRYKLEVDGNYRFRVNRSIPFGVASSRAEFKLKNFGEVIQHVTVTTTINSFGREAESVLPY